MGRGNGCRARFQRERSAQSPQSLGSYCSVWRVPDVACAASKGAARLRFGMAQRPRPKKSLQIGQRILLPNQQFLDAGRDARNRFLALAYYQQTHGGRLPPDPANPPSLESQILDSNWRRETLNGYDFQIDVIDRPRITYGTVSQTNKPKRSRRLQARAGGADRRPTDDGGHFWAARFDGPLVRFNHFAQDANFNRGAYRAMEDEWAAHRRADRSVFASIKPYYSGTSRRPYKIVVTWSVDGGRRETRTFWNEAKGKPRGAK